MYVHTKFSTRTSSSLVTVIEWKTDYTFRVTAMLLIYILQLKLLSSRFV
jgi:hypothetical protein